MKQLLLLFTFSVFVITTISAQGSRPYFQNLAIAGGTQDNVGVNYLLLHKAYAGTLQPDSYIFGTITAIRGGVAGWNRKLTLEVNTSSAYDATRGSLICYNEPASLVTVTFNGERYLAIAIQKSSTLYDFSFTGYGQGGVLVIVFEEHVSNVQPFVDLDAITIPGNVGIGTYNPQSKLAVNGTVTAKKVVDNQSGWADFVFDENYKLPSLKATEEYINTHKHLPDVPSASEIEKEGQDVGEMNKILLQKVEELTLHIINMKKELEQQKGQIDSLIKKR